MSDKLDNFVRAISKDDLVRFDRKLLCEFALEVKSSPVWIQMQRIQSLPHGGNGLG